MKVVTRMKSADCLLNCGSVCAVDYTIFNFTKFTNFSTCEDILLENAYLFSLKLYVHLQLCIFAKIRTAFCTGVREELCI